MSKIIDADGIQPIFTHKIGRHSSKPSRAYPVIQLPLKFKSLAGRTAHVSQTQNKGEFAFLITIDEKSCNYVATDNLDKRLSSLESKTNTILQFIQANNAPSNPISKKGAPKSELDRAGRKQSDCVTQLFYRGSVSLFRPLDHDQDSL
jgi:hypothetical protein